MSWRVGLHLHNRMSRGRVLRSLVGREVVLGRVLSWAHVRLGWNFPLERVPVRRLKLLGFLELRRLLLRSRGEMVSVILCSENRRFLFLVLVSAGLRRPVRLLGGLKSGLLTVLYWFVLSSKDHLILSLLKFSSWYVPVTVGVSRLFHLFNLGCSVSMRALFRGLAPLLLRRFLD